MKARMLELGLLLLSAVVLAVALAALEISQGNEVTTGMLGLVGGYVAIFAVAHLVLCWRAPYADQIMLPVVAVLNAVGLTMIYRLNLGSESSPPVSGQVMWTVVGVALMVVVTVFLRDHRSLHNYSYLLGVAGLVLLALPIVWPSSTSADAKVWISVGPFSIQPGEFSKIMLLLFFAALLVNKRSLFTVAGRNVLGLQFPRLRDLGPILVVWGVALVIMAAMNDFGPALLLFGTVLGMLYMATGRASWLVVGIGLAAVGAYGVFQISDKIQDRFTNFIDPVANFDGTGYQPAQALFGLSFGGITGTGLGEGYPNMVPVAHSDYILAAIGEELGLVGLLAVLMLFVVFVSRGFAAAMQVRDSYGKLVAAGLSLTIAIQVFVVGGGISAMLPMTGLTTPFMSHGGSSLLANYILLAILLRISDSARRPAVIGAGAGAAPVPPVSPAVPAVAAAGHAPAAGYVPETGHQPAVDPGRGTTP